jgi:hypothetical protein
MMRSSDSAWRNSAAGRDVEFLSLVSSASLRVQVFDTCVPQVARFPRLSRAVSGSTYNDDTGGE